MNHHSIIKNRLSVEFGDVLSAQALELIAAVSAQGLFFGFEAKRLDAPKLVESIGILAGHIAGYVASREGHKETIKAAIALSMDLYGDSLKAHLDELARKEAP